MVPASPEGKGTQPEELWDQNQKGRLLKVLCLNWVYSAAVDHHREKSCSLRQGMWNYKNTLQWNLTAFFKTFSKYLANCFSTELLLKCFGANGQTKTKNETGNEGEMSNRTIITWTNLQTDWCHHKVILLLTNESEKIGILKCLFLRCRKTNTSSAFAWWTVQSTIKTHCWTNTEVHGAAEPANPAAGHS